MACGRIFRKACLCRSLHGWRRSATVVGLVLFSIAIAVPRSTMADPIKAGVEAKVSGGYARLVFSMSAYDEASVRQAGSVLGVALFGSLLGGPAGFLPGARTALLIAAAMAICALAAVLAGLPRKANR